MSDMLLVRALSKITRGAADECWPWRAALHNGYGRLWITESGRRRSVAAHVVVYEALVGPVPEGLELDHLCRNRACSNPAHLEPVTRRENLLRGDTITARNAAKTHCDHGHEFTAANIYRDVDGCRQCRECKRARDRAAYAARRRVVA
jgi:hypothetical protein